MGWILWIVVLIACVVATLIFGKYNELLSEDEERFRKPVTAFIVCLVIAVWSALSALFATLRL